MLNANSGADGEDSNGHMSTIKFIDNLQGIDPGQWRALLARCPDSTVFQSPEWLCSWWRTLGEQFKPFIVAAYEDSQLVGLAPLFQKPHKVLGVTRAQLHFIGAGHSDYNVFSVRDGDARIAAQLLDAVSDHIDSGGCAQLVEIPDSSVTHAALERRVATGLTGLQVSGKTPCPRLQIRGNEAGVTRALRKESLRRHFKALSKLGELHVQHLSDADSILGYLDELFRQHVARWARTPHPSIFLQPAHQRFYREMVCSLAPTQNLLFTTVHVNQRPVALHLGFRSRGDLLWYKPTFELELRKCSPGDTLLKSLIEFAQTQEIGAVDFTRGDEAYKGRFSTSIQHNVNYEWIPHRIDRYFWEAARHARRTLRSWAGRFSGDNAADRNRHET